MALCDKEQLLRTFIALELPPDFAADVTTLARRLDAVIDGRFLPQANRHLTLAFLGDVDQTELAAAIDALEAACADVEPLPLRSDRLGKFGKAHDATLWLGLEKQPALMNLADRLREELTVRDVPFDNKAFKPHITLARHANIPKKELGDLVFPQDDKATRITLYKSTLDKDGATYKPLHTVELS